MKSFYPKTTKRNAPSKRIVRRQMHSIGSVECFLMLCKSCVIVTKWDSDRFMVGPLHSLDLVLNQVLNANSLFKFTVPSQTSCWLSRSSISLHRSHRELWKAFQDFSIHRKKTLLCHFSIKLKTKQQSSFIHYDSKEGATSCSSSSKPTAEAAAAAVVVYHTGFRSLPFDYKKR